MCKQGAAGTTEYDRRTRASCRAYPYTCTSGDTVSGRPGKLADARAFREGKAPIRERITCTPQEVRHATIRMIQVLASYGLSVEDCVRAEVVLAEVMNNVTEHAFRCRLPGFLSVSILRDGRSLCVTVEDNGAPMPGNCLPQGHPQDLTVDLGDLPEGGFGWYLIRELTEDLCYQRRNEVNLLTFRLTTAEEW
ncbi:ATP-binding protein [Tropicimonas marinistellae]|uniref:ATP-binding protein n=1 Tax=Tropicimonas marinistellae TaxID=1739787 RepID=UPI00082A9C62|nr:ATP-binding protein [Tropicimonas marinistellae]